jgi:TolB-like protein/DNA-binding winged helix-turn-helix (wHTH) protein
VPGPILEFGDYRLDCDRFELCRAGRPLKLERKPTELLILLATREGEIVTRTEIAAHLWGSEVFVDTEHGINTAIRKVRQALRDDPEQPRFLHTVTGRGYRFVGPVVALRLPFATTLQQTVVPTEPSAAAAPLALASAPESTTHVGKTSDARLYARTRSWLISGAVAALLLIALVGTLLFREHTTHASAPAIQSLAVLPLENLSGDPQQDYFAAGMTDELTTMLAKDSTLRVISRTSAMQYKDAHRPLREIAGTLGVDGIVEGSISRADGKVHMTVQLIHAATDTHLWADSYDRDNNDVAALPGEAAQAIAKRLNATVATTKPARYINPEAHDAYLQGRYRLFSSKDGGGAYFKKAVEIQPDYAAGWAGLAEYYGSGSASNLDPRQVFGPMMVAARKSVELDDSLPEAHMALGEALFYIQWDWAGGERETRRAIQLDPEYSEAHHRLAEMLAALNRHQEAIAEQKVATELDPFERSRAMAYLYQLARQYDAALADLKQRLAATPDDGGLLYTLADVYRCKHMYKESVDAWVQLLTVLNQKSGAETTRRQYARGGYQEVFRGRIAYDEKRSSTEYVPPYNLAQSYAELKQKEKTLDLLEQAFRIRDPNLLYVQCDPAFDFLHKEERYRSLVQKIGLPPAW